MLSNRRYLLADSILLDNYGAVYIVNAKDLLLSDSIIPTDPIPLNVRIRQYAIMVYRTRVITKVFNRV